MHNNVTPLHEFNPLSDEDIDVGENSILSAEKYKDGPQIYKTSQGDYQNIKVMKKKGGGKKLASTFYRETG